MKKFMLFLISILSLQVLYAGWGPDLCEDVTCSGHGYCDEDGDNEWCVCDAGYVAEGLSCVQGCVDVNCSGHGTCSVSGGQEICTCETGFHADGLQCIIDGASGTDNLTILNETECADTGNCHYRFIFASGYYSFTPENASFYDIILNIKDPDENWHNYWKTVDQCVAEGVCDNIDAQYVDFWWQHEIGGEQYVALEIVGNGDDAYDHIYHDVNLCLNIDCDGYGTCVEQDGEAVCNCDNGYHNPSGDMLSCDVGFAVIGGDVTYINFEGISISIPDGAAPAGTVINIELVNEEDLPVSSETRSIFLNSETSAGYKIIVDGDENYTFSSDITISIAYDQSKVVDVSGEKENVFVYSLIGKTWKPIQRLSNDSRTGTITVKSDSAGTYSAQTLNIQNNPPQAKGINTVPTGIEELNPMQGIKEIVPPVANRKGSAEVSIPIEVPEGVNGLTPKLSIDYSSDDRKMGNCGFGWNLKTSSIEIKTKNKGIPKYDGTDTYLLDGEELVHVGSENGKEIYRLMNETSFMKIEKVSREDGIEYFIVNNPDGTKKRYGFDRNSRISEEAPDYSKVFRWYIEREEGSFGNTIKYLYSGNIKEFEKDDGVTLNKNRESLLNNISYGYNSNIIIKFNWMSRLEKNVNPKLQPDGGANNTSMIPGFFIFESKLLSEIEIFSKELTPERSEKVYRLNYEFDQSETKSLLKSVEETDGEIVKNSYSFDYSNIEEYADESNNPIFFRGIIDHLNYSEKNLVSQNILPSGENCNTFQKDTLSLTQSLSTAGNTNEYNSLNLIQIGFFDINGDGLPDRVAKKDPYLDLTDPNSNWPEYGDYYVLLNRGYEYDNFNKLSASEIYSVPGITNPYFKYIPNWNSTPNYNFHDVLSSSYSYGYADTQSYHNHGDTGHSLLTIDVNGDGLPDRIGIMAEDGSSGKYSTIFIQYNIGNGYRNWEEVEVDPIPDEIINKYFMNNNYLVYETTENRDTDLNEITDCNVNIIDVNGDGKVDRVFLITTPDGSRKNLVQLNSLCTDSGGNVNICFKNSIVEFDGFLSKSKNYSGYYVVEGAGINLFPSNYTVQENIDINGDGLLDSFLIAPSSTCDGCVLECGSKFVGSLGFYGGYYSFDELFYEHACGAEKFINASLTESQSFNPDLDPNPPLVLYGSETLQKVYQKTIDINGDGMADIIFEENGKFFVYLNKGHGLYRLPYELGIVSIGHNNNIFETRDTYQNGFWGNSNEYDSRNLGFSNIEWVDFNGDGFIDIVSKKGEDKYEVLINQFSKMNLLKSMNNDITGSKTTIKYKNVYIDKMARNDYDGGFSDDQYYNVSNYRKKLCMVETTIENDQSIFPVKIFNTFDYFDGYYDRVEKEFRGFKDVISETCPFSDDETSGKICVSDKKVNKQEYGFVGETTGEKDVYGINDLYRQYLYKQLTAIEAGIQLLSDSSYIPVSRKEYSYGLKTLVPSSGDKKAVKKYYLLEGLNYIYSESGTGVALELTENNFVFTNDGTIYNRIQSVESEHHNDPRVIKDDFTSFKNYHFDQTNWVYKVDLEKANDVNGNFINKKEFVYNENGSLADILDYIDSENYLTTSYTYDSYGNIATEQKPDGLISEINTIIVNDGETYFRKRIVPAHTSGSPEKVVPVEEDFDYWGRKIKSTVIYNGSNTPDYERYEYDQRGRIHDVYKTISGVEKKIKVFGYDIRESSGKKYFISQGYYSDGFNSYPDTHTSLQNVVVFDAAGRKFQAMTKIESSDGLKWLVSGDIKRNEHGKVVKQNRSYSVNLANDFPYVRNEFNDATTFEYDNRGRLIEVVIPGYDDDAGFVPQYEVSLEYETLLIDDNEFYNGGTSASQLVARKVTKRDSLGKESIEYKGITGNVIRSAEKNVSGNYNVKRFAKDLIGNQWVYEQEISSPDILYGITTESSNILGSKRHDALGRLVCMGSPDTGMTYYHYNEEGLMDIKSECGKDYEKSLCSEGIPEYTGGVIDNPFFQGDSRPSISGCRNTYFEYDQLKRLEYILRPYDYNDQLDYLGADNRDISLSYDSSERIIYYESDDANKYNQNQIKWLLRGNYSAVGFSFGEFLVEETRHILSGISRSNFSGLEHDGSILTFLDDEFVSSSFVYNYDIQGRIEQIQYPDGKIVEYDYNNGGMLEKIFEVRDDQDYNYVVYDYDENGQKSLATFGNGNVTKYSYYPENGMLKSVLKENSVTDPTASVDLHYRYYPDGNVRSINDSNLDYLSLERSDQQYSYDLNGRIERGLGTLYGNRLYDRGYTFDDANRIKGRSFYRQKDYDSVWNDPTANSSMEYIYNDQDHAVDSLTYFYSNQSDGRVDFYYNKYGSMIFEYLYNDVNAPTNNWQFGRQMFYDSSNRMKYLSDWRYDEDRQTHYTGKLIQYKYDHQGKRIRKWGTYGCDPVDGCTSGNVVMSIQKFYHGDYYETYGKGLITYKHISDGQNVIATEADIGDILCDQCTPSNYYYTQNHIGSTVQLSNDNGDAVEHMIYTPFGQMAAHWSSLETGPNGFVPGILFTGQRFDGDTGQYYFKARYYDPTIGIFTRPDPALDGLNHYVYANANPIKYVDPSGMVADRAYMTRELAYHLGLIDFQKKQEQEINRAAEKGEKLKEYSLVFYDAEDQYGTYYSYSIVFEGSEGQASANAIKKTKERALAVNDIAKSYNFTSKSNGNQMSVIKTVKPMIFVHNHYNGDAGISGNPHMETGDWKTAYKNNVALFIIGQEPEKDFYIKYHNQGFNVELIKDGFTSKKAEEIIRKIRDEENPEF